jgi:hypothetical protein
MVIITPSLYSHDLDLLIEHKNSFGVKTISKTVESIDNEFEGFDIQEKIKNYICYAYDTWHIKYVLFVGDYTQNPPRYCYNNDSYYNMEPYFISDLYYADLYMDNGSFSSWDVDHDGLIGEWNGDSADDYNISLTPEIGVGRIPCRNRFELFVMTQKIIKYEKRTTASDWFCDFVVAGGDTYSQANGYDGSQYEALEGEVYTEQAIQVMTDFHPIRLWASTKTLTSLKLIKAINKGCGFIYLSGHGDSKVWVTCSYNSSHRIGYFSNIMMLFLVNDRELPVCIVGGCHNSQFDLRIGTCWSWKLTNRPLGGAIATIGITGLGYNGIEYGSGGNNWINLQFFKEYVNGSIFLGDVWKNSICTYLKSFPIDWNTPNGCTSSLDAKTVQEWVLIGDPSLKIGGYPNV